MIKTFTKIMPFTDSRTLEVYTYDRLDQKDLLGATIKDEFGNVESSTVLSTTKELSEWIEAHR